MQSKTTPPSAVLSMHVDCGPPGDKTNQIKESTMHDIQSVKYYLSYTRHSKPVKAKTLHSQEHICTHVDCRCPGNTVRHTNRRQHRAWQRQLSTNMRTEAQP